MIFFILNRFPLSWSLSFILKPFLWTNCTCDVNSIWNWLTYKNARAHILAHRRCGRKLTWKCCRRHNMGVDSPKYCKLAPSQTLTTQICTHLILKKIARVRGFMLCIMKWFLEQALHRCFCSKIIPVMYAWLSVRIRENVWRADLRSWVSRDVTIDLDRTRFPQWWII